MSHVIDFLNNGTPWAITQSALETIISVAKRENNLQAFLKERDKNYFEQNGNNVSIKNGIAEISVFGALFPRANLLTEISAAYSVELLSKDLANARADSSIKAVVLKIDSPGGYTTLINEFSAQIKAFDKPIVAYVVGQACSAAYWIAAATDKIYLDNTAIVGSIGVVAVFSQDDAETIEFVSSNASDKRPDLQTDTGRAVIQSMVDDMEAVFIESIMSNRGMSREQITQLRGGVLVGAKAVSAGFADEISNLEAVIQSLNEVHNVDITKLKAEHPAVIQSLNEVHNVDITKLKAEHPAVYQAGFDEGKNSINASAIVTDERARISGILNCEAAKGREAQALTMALETDLNAEQAAKILASAPLASTLESFTPKAKTPFEKQMEALGNPKVGVDGQDDGEPNAQDDAAKLSASVLSFLPAANVRK